MKIINHVVACGEEVLVGDSCGPTNTGILAILYSMNHAGEFLIDGESCMRNQVAELRLKLKLTVSELPS